MQSIRIVLVEPCHPGNIGSAARAMKTMGLTELRLVNPLRFPDPQADWRAAGAIDVVRQASVFPSVEEAIRDSVVVAATSARARHVSWPCCTAEEFAKNLAHGRFAGESTCIVFGRESDGLTNRELELCQLQVQIPSHEDYRSLNLAMSVQVVAYEIFKAHAGSVHFQSDAEMSTAGEFDEFFEHLVRVLERIDFYDPRNPRLAVPKLRRLFNRLRMERVEIAMLRGILSHIERVTPGPPGRRICSSK